MLNYGDYFFNSVQHLSNPSNQSLIVKSSADTEFQHILRVLNTNIDGRKKIMYALTDIKGVGRRFANLVCKKANVDLTRRAGELSKDEIEKVVTIIQHPGQFKIPNWFLNRQKDFKTGTYSQIVSNNIASILRDDLQRLKKKLGHIVVFGIIGN